MNSHYKSILFLHFLTLQSVLLVGQAGTSFTNILAEKFNRYCKAIPREEIYVHTDRNEYIAGENIWLKAYLFDRSGSVLTQGSDVVYAELVNPMNQPVVQKKVGIEKGSGPGLVMLPDTLSTGIYILRAYTAWMKNFLPVNCFMKEIKVYNSLNSKRLSGIPGIGIITGEKIPVQNSDTLTGSGFSVKVINNRPDTLEVLISTNESFRIRNGNLFYMFIQTHGVINFNEPVRLKGSNTRIPVPKNVMISGINQLVLFSSDGKPLSEEYFYTPVGDNKQLSLNSPDTFQKRSKVQIEIDPADISGANTGEMHLSFSAASGPSDDDEANMADYMAFGTEFGALPDVIRDRKLSTVPIEAINNFLASAKSNWIDWNAILSGNYPDLKYRMEKDYHSLSGFLVRTGSLVPDTGRYVFLSQPGKTAYFKYAKTDGKGRFSFTLPSSLSEKEVIVQPDEADSRDIIKLESSFPDIYFPVNKMAKAFPRVEPSYISEWSVNYQVSKIYGSSSTGNAVKSDKHFTDLIRFYGKPDMEIKMDDYIKLPVMQEVFFELIPGVSLKSRKSVWEITITDPVERTIYNSPPLLLVDGVVVRDASVISNLDPELVEKIDVITDKYIVGDYLISGIVNVITRKADFSIVTLPDYAMHLRYRITDPVYSFSSPGYSSETLKNNHIPDFRNTLYWNPSLKKDDDGKFRVEFYSSDIESDYIINIQGVTFDDKPVSLRKIISVK